MHFAASAKKGNVCLCFRENKLMCFVYICIHLSRTHAYTKHSCCCVIINIFVMGSFFCQSIWLPCMTLPLYPKNESCSPLSLAITCVAEVRTPESTGFSCGLTRPSYFMEIMEIYVSSTTLNSVIFTQSYSSCTCNTVIWSHENVFPLQANKSGQDITIHIFQFLDKPLLMGNYVIKVLVPSWKWLLMKQAGEFFPKCCSDWTSDYIQGLENLNEQVKFSSL